MKEKKHVPMNNFDSFPVLLHSTSVSNSNICLIIIYNFDILKNSAT